MSELNQKELEMLSELIMKFRPNCDYDCYNCNYGMLRSYSDGYDCPLGNVQDLVRDEANKLRQMGG